MEGRRSRREKKGEMEVEGGEKGEMEGENEGEGSGGRRREKGEVETGE